MKNFSIFLIMIGISCALLITMFVQESHALTLGMSSEQILKTQDIVILGHIDSVDLKPDATEYAVDVLKYIKSPKEFEKNEKIDVMGCPKGQRGGCHIFSQSENVLFALNEKNDILQVSEFSNFLHQIQWHV